MHRFQTKPFFHARGWSQFCFAKLLLAMRPGWSRIYIRKFAARHASWLIAGLRGKAAACPKAAQGAGRDFAK
jgi:hypothetical protein